MNEPAIQIRKKEAKDLEEIALNDKRHPFVKATDVYFKPRFFEKSGRMYELLGVKPFRKLVIGTIGRVFKSVEMDKFPGSYFIGKGYHQNIGTYESMARISEVIHAPLVILGCVDLISGIGERDIGKIAGASALALVNAYCTMLQRYNRAKAYNILERRGER